MSNQQQSNYGPREMVAGDLYGETVPVVEFGFKPAWNCFGEMNGGHTLHGKTGTEMSLIVNPNDPKKWRESDELHVDIDGPNGRLSGYIEASMFAAVCKALGVQS
jgi:hypothetical protein